MSEVILWNVIGIMAIVAYVALIAVALLQIYRSTMPTNTKLLWLIVILVAPFLGPLIWFAIGRNSTLL
ncbi:PLDc N-terminal domain-containing protein [Salinibacterium sp. SWN248]|uniref:PLDc N-terminal domain-containing protein n=1 Tax=Salinibacterium sp. SWN248 TaxID=2792056 RepID=UPI0018CDCAA5|nr:PLDc N-terminal domain-containing protein [Salinibacterium sp. SWN248]MBH0023387.1 PLDc N-terminal domain-containing protein [Salinibacterium sp. SWN248]